MHQPTMIDTSGTCSDDANIDYGNRFLFIAWENTGSPKRVRHAGDQHVIFLQEGAVKFGCFLQRHEAVRLVSVIAITDIGQLNQTDISLWVLVFGFYPITVDKNAVASNYLFKFY